jgi:hypothetical protein
MVFGWYKVASLQLYTILPNSPLLAWPLTEIQDTAALKIITLLPINHPGPIRSTPLLREQINNSLFPSVKTYPSGGGPPSELQSVQERLWRVPGLWVVNHPKLL